MTYISTTFSLDMIPLKDFILVRVKKVNLSNIHPTEVCAIGDKKKKKIASDILGWEVEYKEEFTTLEKEDVLYVVQFKGSKMIAEPEMELLEITMKGGECENCNDEIDVYDSRISFNNCRICDFMFWVIGD